MNYDQQIFNGRLRSLGGYDISGRPRLRVVSALTETKYACGGEKIKYPQASKLVEEWLWGLKDMDTGIITGKSEQDVIEDTDPRKFGVRKLLKREVTWLGYPNYVVEYYRSPLQMKDGPLNWERNRFNWWLNPVTKRREWTDINGPWPSEGRYDLLLVVKIEDGTPWGQFRELGEDVLDEVRKAMRAHEAFRKVNTDEELIRHMEEVQEAKEEKLEAEIADALDQELKPHWRHLYSDMPQMFMYQGDPAKMNKITKHGRAR